MNKDIKCIVSIIPCKYKDRNNRISKELIAIKLNV